MKSFLKNKTAVIVAVVLLLLIVAAATLYRTHPWVLTLVVIAIIVMGLLWISVELFLKARKRRKQRRFDESLAAKEGIEDRRREWAQWSAELDRQEIDRYELPFYLLVGEPQSGKSILLQNSDLHFPFGQTRLSGVGGTRGCDWWFTDEAVILDLAGRLFTHEGGAADELEWAAFLDLLAEFRPLCPANGILLVIPCDGLLDDQRDAALHKAAKMQNALITLTNKLQAQLPVYVVLTKGDKVFGFAECVHRLDQPQRQQMFGWSRANKRVDAPFELEEARGGFDALVERARLLRAEMMATAKLPEAMPEVHRLIAFPEELKGLWPNLELYLRTVFTDSNLTERLYFRGLYLTSGLQTGVPIAKVCAALIGGHREADSRALEALFTKQRAYFIRDLVRERVFGERGLVRPTSGRLKRARRTARLGYGVAAAIALVAVLGAVQVGWSAETKTPREQRALDSAIERLAARVPIESIEPAAIASILDDLAALDHPPPIEGSFAAKLMQGRDRSLARLRETAVERQLAPLARRAAALALIEQLQAFDGRFDDFKRLLDDAREHLGALELGSDGDGLAALAGRTRPEELALKQRFAEHGSARLPAPDYEHVAEFKTLAAKFRDALDQVLQPGCRWQAGGQVGYVIAWMGAKQGFEELRKCSTTSFADVHAKAERFHNASVAAKNYLPPGGKLERDTIEGAELADLEGLRSDFDGSFPGAGRDLQLWKQRVDLEQFLDSDVFTPVGGKPSSTRDVPPSSVQGLVPDKELEEACASRFLPADGWNWNDLRANVERGADFKAGSPASGVFRAKLAFIADAFDSRVKRCADIESSGLFAASGRSTRAAPFDVDFVRSAAELGTSLARSSGFDGLRRRIATLIAEHLNAARGASSVTQPGDLEALSAALTEVRKLADSAATAAADTAFAAVLDGIQSTALEGWRRADASSAAAVQQVFDEFASQEQMLRRSVGDANLDAARTGTSWVQEVDQRLADLLQPAIDRMKLALEPTRPAANARLADAAQSLRSGLLAHNIRPVDPALIPRIALEVGELPKSMLKASAALSAFRQLQEERDPDQIARLPYVQQVSKKLADFESVPDDIATGELIGRLRQAGVAAPEGANVSGGHTLAYHSWTAFRDHALGLLRARCEQRVRERILVPAEPLARLLVTRDPDTVLDPRVDYLTQAHLVFDKGAALDRVRLEFELDAELKFDLRVNDEADLARRHVLQFADALQLLAPFLRGDDGRIDSTELTLTITPDAEGPSRRVWAGDDRALGFPYLERYSLGGDRQSERPEREGLTEKQALPWRLDTHSSLAFAWNPRVLGKSESVESPNYRRIRTCFAPLLLAWSGEQDPRGGRKIDALKNAVRSGSEGAKNAWALVLLSHPKAGALPDQPPSPFD